MAPPVIPWWALAGVLLWVVVVAAFALLLGFNDHPPARGLLRRSRSPNPPSRL